MSATTIPVKGQSFVFHMALISQADAKLYQTNPTLATGDVKVQTDDGSLANITILPTAAASSARVKVVLSADEMNGDNVWVQFRDAAGAEWCDTAVNIQTSVRGVDDLATPTNITAGVITTTTNLTNAPTNGDLTAAMIVSVTAAATAATPTAASVTGDVGGKVLGGGSGTITGTGARADVREWLGSAPDALSSGKVPADLKLWLAAAPAALSTSGYVQAMLLRWLTDAAAGTPLALYAGDAGNMIRSIDTIDIIAYNTCQAGSTAGTIVLHAGANANDDFYSECWIGTRTGTAAGQTRFIYDYDGASRTCYVTPNWNNDVAPDGTTTFLVKGRPRVGVGAMAGSVAQAGYLDAAVSGIASSLVTVLARLGGWAGSGINTILGAFRALTAKTAALTPTDISTGTTFDNTTDSVEAVRDRGDAAWTTATGFSTTAEIAAVQADTDNIQARLPAALVGGRMDADVGNMQANTVTAAAVATDALGSLELAAGATAEIVAGVAAILPSGTSAIVGSIVAGLTPTTTTFKTNLPGAVDNMYVGYDLAPITATNSTYVGLAFRIESSVAATGVVTIVASPTALSIGDTFKLVQSSNPLLAQVPGIGATGSAAAALARIGSGQIITTSPVSQSGDITITRGDDYYAADNRALEWTEGAASAWPTLTGATIAVEFEGPNEELAAIAGSVVTPTGTKKVRLELSAVQTAGFAAGVTDIRVKATLSNTHVVTLVVGRANILDDA